MSSSATGSRSEARAALRATIARMPPNAFSFVMATGIVGVAFTLEGIPVVGIVLCAVAVGGLIVLAVALGARIGISRSAVWADLHDPTRTFGFWTIVAALAVVASLASALHTPGWAVWLLAGLALPLWALLTYGALPLLVRRRDGGRPVAADADGSWFLVVVGTQAMAILCALLGFGMPALAAWGVGVVLYLLVLVLVVMRLLGTHDGPEDVAPTAWVVMGATAISALAAAHVVQAGEVAASAPFLLGAALVLWGFGTWCIPFLVLLGVFKHLVRRERLRYQTGLWSMVFPLGMYATTTHTLSTMVGAPLLEVIAVVALWIAAAAWVVVTVLGGAALVRTRR